MGLVEKTIYTLGVEWEKMSLTFQRLWEGLNSDEKLMVFGIAGAFLMLMFLSRMRRVRSRNYIRADERNRNIAFFYAAVVIIGVFSFGVDILIDTVNA